MGILTKLRIAIIFIFISVLSFSIPLYPLNANSADNTILHEEWNYQANEGDFLEEIKFDNDGGIFLSNDGSFVSYIISLDSEGDLIWDYYLMDREFNYYFITEDYIYLANTLKSSNQLTLLSKDTGRKIKEVSLDLREDETIYKLTANYDGYIFVTTEDKFIIFDKNGKRKWQLSVSVPLNFTPVIGPNGNIYVLGNVNDNHYILYSINPKGISWTTYLEFEGYSFVTNNSEPPILFDKDRTLYIKDEFTVYSIDERDGDINWEYSFEKYNGNYSSYNFLLEADQNYYDGVDANRSQSLVNKVDDKIILYSNYEIIALDEDDGNEEYFFDRGRYPIKDIVELDGRIYAAFDRIYTFDEDGDIEWSFNLGNIYAYNNIELQVDYYGNIYLYEYGYNAEKGTLRFISSNGNLIWENSDLPADRHDWYMTENGPIYITEKYNNGQYQSQLYLIQSDKTISQVKLDGFVTKVFEKDGYIYFLTNARLYAFIFPYNNNYYYGDDGSQSVDNSACYSYTDNNLNNLKGYRLDKDWDYRLYYDDYDVKQVVDEEDNVYLLFYDDDYLEFIYSLDSDGDFKWKYNLESEIVSSLFISDDYLHLYDTDYDNNEFILVNKDTGKKIKDYKLYFSTDINDISFDLDGNMYIAAENGLSKYNYSGYRLWNLVIDIPATQNVIGPDGTIFVIKHNYGDNYQLYALKESGSIKWSTNLIFDRFSLDDKKYPIQFDDKGNLYILNDGDNTLYSIDATDGDVNFRYTGSEDFNLLSIMDKTNEQLPQYQNRSKDIVWTVDNKVVIYSDKQIYALNSDNGKTAWSFSSSSKLQDIGAEEDSIYVIFDKLYELNKYGKKVWTYDLKGKQYKNSSLVINDYGFIYAIENKYNDKGGLIHALDDRKLKWQYSSSTSTEQSWYLLDDVPIFTSYNRGLRSSEINLVNNSGISKVVVSGEVIDITEDDDTIYVLTDKQLYKFDKTYGYMNQTRNICVK